MVLMFSPHLARHLIISAEIQRMITLNIIKCMAKLESRFEARMSLLGKFTISTICRYFENDLNLNRKFPEKIHRVKKKPFATSFESFFFLRPFFDRARINIGLFLRCCSLHVIIAAIIVRDAITMHLCCAIVLARFCFDFVSITCFR